MAAKKLPQSFSVRVTAHDIAEGRPSNIMQCPLALALTRRLGRPALAGSEDAGVVIHDREEWRWTHNGNQFISHFDRGDPVAPCTVQFTHVKSDRRFERAYVES